MFGILLATFMPSGAMLAYASYKYTRPEYHTKNIPPSYKYNAWAGSF